MTSEQIFPLIIGLGLIGLFVYMFIIIPISIILEEERMKKLKMKKIIEKEKEYQETGNLREFIYFLYENEYITFLLDTDLYTAVERKVNREFKHRMGEIACEMKVAKNTLLRLYDFYTEEDEEYTDSFIMLKVRKFLTKDKHPDASTGSLLLANGYAFNEFQLDNNSFYRKYVVEGVFIANYLMRYVDDATWKAAIKYNKKGDKLFLDSEILF